MPELTMILSVSSAAISVASFGLAARMAWVTKFSPPRLLGVASNLMLFTFRSKVHTSTEQFLVPILWLTNSGAKPMLVQDLRLRIEIEGGEVHELSPGHTVPIEVVETAHTFSDFETVRHGLAPFGGFAVLPGEQWVNRYAFPVSLGSLDSLGRAGTVTLLFKQIGSKEFVGAIEQRFSFASEEANWVTWAALEGPSLHYFYAEGAPHSDA